MIDKIVIVIGGKSRKSIGKKAVIKDVMVFNGREMANIEFEESGWNLLIETENLKEVRC